MLSYHNHFIWIKIIDAINETYQQYCVISNMGEVDKEKFLEMMMPKNHTYQLVCGIVFFIVWFLDAFLLRITTVYADLLPFWLPLFLALIIFIVCLYLIDASHKALFNSGPFGLRTEGVFASVRHPMYLGTVLFYLTLAVAVISLASILTFCMVFLVYNYIADFEEKQLEMRFGVEFLEYKERVGKWGPRWK